MGADTLTQDEASKIGRVLRDAEDGNLIVGSFAAELINESYPLSKAMCSVVFENHTDEWLGRKFAEWCDKKEK